MDPAVPKGDTVCQCVSVNGVNSDWAQVASGISQGSILGPVLFVMFINDLLEVVHSMAEMFADDTRCSDL